MPGIRSKKTLAFGKRIRVLVVDDSPVMRRLVTLALAEDTLIEVVGDAGHGREALDRLSSLQPDAITMDIEMPEMDGLEALRQIRKLASPVRVIMLSTLTERGASATFEALALGADDYVTKPSAGKSVSDSKVKMCAELAPKIKQFFSVAETSLPLAESLSSAGVSKPVPVPAKTEFPAERQSRFRYLPQVIVIGVSTGGPTALANIIPRIPGDFPLPILVVQHMAALFTRQLCERLQERSKLCVREAVHSEILKAGTIYLAPGNYHMRVQLSRGETQKRLVLDQGPPENSCRPAVDVLFESVASVFGGAAVAAVLTGMGQDGLRGAGLLRKAGATIFAQDEATSAVWGMPRAIVEANLADAVLPLGEIIPRMIQTIEPALVARTLPAAGDA